MSLDDKSQAGAHESDPMYLDEVYGASLLQIDQTRPEPVTTVHRLRNSWFKLPPEIRLMIMKFVFCDDNLQAQIEGGTFHSQKGIPRTFEKITFNSENSLHHYKQLLFIRTLPAFKHCFVSKRFLGEALFWYGEVSYVLLENVAPERGPYCVPGITPIMTRALSNFVNNVRNVVLCTDHWPLGRPMRLLCTTSNIRRIDVVCIPNIVWASTRWHGLRDGFMQLRRSREMLDSFGPMSMRILSRDEVSSLLQDLKVPAALGRVLKKNCIVSDWNHIPNSSSDLSLRYPEAVWMQLLLHRRGWKGRMFYHIEFGCRITVTEDDEGEATGSMNAMLRLEIDLLTEQVVCAVFTV